MKKGFTLIELLAVIVILAIILLIAAPIVLNIISGTKDSSLISSAENYIKAVELAIANKQTKDPSFMIVDDTYIIQKDGNVCLGNLIDGKCDNEILKVEVDGEKPSGEKIVLENKKVIRATLKFGNKTIEKIYNGKLEVVKSLDEKYEESKKNGDFSGTLDNYILQEKYDITLGSIVNYDSKVDSYDGKWVVLGIDDDYNVLLVSTKTIGTMTLKGKDGYENGPKKLDEMCSIYANGTTGTSARSIRVEDLNELVGYNPEKEMNGKVFKKGHMWEYGNEVTYTYKDGKYYYSSSNGLKGYIDFGEETNYKEYFENIDGVKLGDTTTDNDEVKIVSDYYNWWIQTNRQDEYRDGNDYYTLNHDGRKNYDRLFFATDIQIDTQAYWLASKSILTNADQYKGATWGLRECQYRGTFAKIDREGLCGALSNDRTVTNYVRAVVRVNKNGHFIENEDGTYNISIDKDSSGSTYVDTNTKAKDEYENEYFIPVGFKVLGQYNVTNGIVIKDKLGNEFVWVPVGNVKTSKTDTTGVNISLGRYTFNNDGSYIASTDPEDNDTKTKEFLESVNKYKGYYIARYEARVNDKQELTLNRDDNVFKKKNWTDSYNLSASMYEENKYFSTSLMNNYAWDTAIVFIQTFENNRTVPYSKQWALNDKSINSVGEASKGTNNLADEYKDKALNIYDLASNYWEWTTEKNASGKYFVRGSSYDANNTTVVSTRKTALGPTTAVNAASFRPILYLK